MAAAGGLPVLYERAIVALPLCFILGVAASDARDAARAHDAALARRVAAALGEWRAPALSAAARRELEAERADVAREVARLEARAAR
jgi:hypothetical protein